MALFHESKCYNKSFSQLAKESNFTFNLYRGRVDWKKLEVLDVDRIVRDQDVELLNIHINSVTNCSLESEYDVKILDPSFIKLFRLAQLLIDFLLHCKHYLEHCIKVAHESLQASNKEVELLRKQVQARKSEVKQLKKKVKEVKLQLQYSPRFPNPTFECTLCGKFFMNEKFLEGHHSRRHTYTPFPVAQKSLNKQTDHYKANIVLEENEQKSENINNMKKNYEDEIEELKSMFFAEIKKLKQSEESKKEVEKGNMFVGDGQIVSDSYKVQISLEEKGEQTSNNVDNKVAVISIKDSPTVVEGVTNESAQKENEIEERDEEWRQRLEDRENVWRTRLSDLDQQHKRQVQQLQARLDSSQLQSQEIKKDLEQRLEEVLSKFEQSQTLLESKNQFKDGNNHENVFHETSTRKVEDEKLDKIQLKENDNVKNPPPFQKRRAFVSQKTKTIQDQDSIESSSQFQGSANNLVKILQTGDESDNESNSLSIKNTSKESIDYTREVGERKQPSFLQSKSNLSEQTSRNKNKESIITKLLEEEKLKEDVLEKTHKGDPVFNEGEDYSMSETLSDSSSESDTSNEKQPQIKTIRQTEILQQFGQKQTDATQNIPKRMIEEEEVVQADADLALKSLQSMEALLSANPTILQQLRGDLQELVGRRLRGLGIDPSWTAIPPTTFRSKMAMLSHQRQITAKNHKVYFTLRDKLNQDAETAVRSRPTQSTANSLLARLRKKAALVANAVKFTHHIERIKKNSSLTPPNRTQSNTLQPLASSSPHESPQTSVKSSTLQGNTPYIIPKIQSEDSMSLSSSTSEEVKEDQFVDMIYSRQPTSTTDAVSYKSALRNAVSTGNLTKKRVLFVDEAIKDDKRSLSENTVATSDSFTSQRNNVSVSSLVQNIQYQLSKRTGKPANSVDLTQPTELPLSQILPLTKSGRELLESESSVAVKTSSLNLSAHISHFEKQSEPLSHMLQKVPISKTSRLTPSTFEVTSTKGAELLSNTLQKVPSVKSSPLPSLEKKNEFPELLSSGLKKPLPKSLLQPPKFSPTHSLTSIGSSLDISLSPRDKKGSLELDLQDLEDNLK